MCVEYEGAAEHGTVDALEADALHRNDLTAAGFTQFWLTADQLADTQLFERVATQIGRALGAELPPRTREFHAKQKALQAEIHAALGRFGF